MMQGVSMPAEQRRDSLLLRNQIAMLPCHLGCHESHLDVACCCKGMLLSGTFLKTFAIAPAGSMSHIGIC